MGIAEILSLVISALLLLLLAWLNVAVTILRVKLNCLEERLIFQEAGSGIKDQIS